MRSGATMNSRSRRARGGRWRLMIITIMMLLHALALDAQDRLAERVLIGVVGSYQRGFELGRFPVFLGSPDCGEFISGTASSLFNGVGFSYGSLFSERLGIAARLTWGSVEGHFIADPHEPLVILDTANNISPSIEHEYRFNSLWDMGRADLLLDYRITDRFSLRPGLWIGLRRSPVLSQTDNIINEPLYRFEAGATERAMLSGEQVSVTSLAAGFSLALAYHMPLTRRLALVPELSLHGDLSSAASNASWRTLTGGGGIGIMFDLTPFQPTPPPPEKPLANEGESAPKNPTAPPRSALHASLDLYGIDEAGTRLPSATIRIHEVLYRQRARLLGPVYFDRGSAELPARYARLGRDEAGRFSVDSLADLDPIVLHHHLLNLLGLRMREYPSATINLIGYRSQGEPASLARARARQVRSYLHETWGIDTGRIAITARTGARAEDGGEGRKVQIASAAASIIEPVVLDKLARDFDPPLIALDPAIDSSVAVREWRIILSYDGKEVGRYSSSDTSSEESSSVRWQIPDRQAELGHSFLVAELTVEDSSGSQVSSRTQTPLTFERTFRIVERREQGDDRERVIYSLLPFGRGSSQLDRRNQTVMREIAAGLRAGARVTIQGYADRAGADVAGETLTLRRGESVAAALRASMRDRGMRNVQIVVKGGGHDGMRNEGSIPEGRVLARDIDVIVEQQAAPAGVE